MAQTATILKRSKNGREVIGIFSLVFSGNYPALGEPLDLRTVIGFTDNDPDNVIIIGVDQYTYKYDYVNRKVIVLAATQLPIPTAAYPAGVLADIIRMRVAWLP